jgi:hypothetical protein
MGLVAAARHRPGQLKPVAVCEATGGTAPAANDAGVNKQVNWGCSAGR